MLLKECQRLGLEVSPRLDAESLHFRGRDRSDAVETVNWQRLDPRPAHLRRYCELAIGLAVVGGELRFAPGEAQAARWYDAQDLGGDEVSTDVAELGRQAIELVGRWEAAQ